MWRRRRHPRPLQSLCQHCCRFRQAYGEATASLPVAKATAAAAVAFRNWAAQKGRVRVQKFRQLLKQVCCVCLPSLILKSLPESLFVSERAAIAHFPPLGSSLPFYGPSFPSEASSSLPPPWAKARRKATQEIYLISRIKYLLLARE